MSGIFGFTYRNADPETLSDALDGLAYWNRIYGREASDSRLMGQTGIGCHMEHFSCDFPFGGPILNVHGCISVIDALLFNRDELFNMLSMAPGTTISDEELILNLIFQKGFDALSAVNGDFSGAIWDESKQEWTVFRDHMGVRPLFYYKSNELFGFSTDLRALAAVPGLDVCVNESMIHSMMTGTGGMTLCDTEFQHIHCIRPGSICRFRLTKQSVEMTETPYWRINQQKVRFENDEEYRAELRRLVTDAVHRRCNAIPGLLGAELSGGLDSSIIDIILNRHGRQAVYYSWSRDPEKHPLRDHDERIIIQDICEQENIECRYLRKEDTFGFDYMMEHLFPPYINTPPIGYGFQWIRSQGARAVFSGHGGDEGVSHRASWLELLCHGEILPYFKLCWEETETMNLRLLRTAKISFMVARNKWKQYNRKPSKTDLKPPVFTDAFNERVIKNYKFQPLTFCYLPVRYINEGGTRPRLDNTAFLGALNDVRYLFPYVDHRVIDFAVSIPRRLHVNHSASRLIFRETFDDLMPQTLREVNYKDTPSTRDIDITRQRNNQFHANADGLLARLDPQLWENILDFDGIKQWSQQSRITTKSEQNQLMHMLGCLNKLLLIQNIQLEAKNWRNRNE